MLMHFQQGLREVYKFFLKCQFFMCSSKNQRQFSLKLHKSKTAQIKYVFLCSQIFLKDFSVMMCYDINITKRKD